MWLRSRRDVATREVGVESVGIRELRDGLSRYLAEVRAGRSITVTDHGRPDRPGRRAQPVGAADRRGTRAAGPPAHAVGAPARRGLRDGERPGRRAAQVIPRFTASAPVALLVEEPGTDISLTVGVGRPGLWPSAPR